MTARVLIVATLVVALLVGASIYWLQEYAYYREIGGEAFEITLAEGGTEVVPVPDFRGIDSNSSPIRYRACFTLPSGDASRFRPYPGATPLIAPRWFDCFDAKAIGAALEGGEATAVLGEPAGTPGIDRVVAIFPDGRAYAWHQIDPCGSLAEERAAFCPPAPEPAAPGGAAVADPPAAVPPAEPAAEPGTP